MLLLGAPVPIAATDCAPRCARAYVHVSPAGLVIPLGEVTNEFANGPRLGYAANVGAGMFRAFGRLGLAFGARAGYSVTRQRFTGFDSRYDYVHVGPELRLGVVGRRLFAFGSLCTGVSRWHLDIADRLSIARTDWLGAHVGFGAGAWGRLGTRTFLGGELVLDVLISERLQAARSRPRCRSACGCDPPGLAAVFSRTAP